MRLELNNLELRLDNLRRRMGAPLRFIEWPDFSLPPPKIDPIELGHGIEVDIKKEQL